MLQREKISLLHLIKFQLLKLPFCMPEMFKEVLLHEDNQTNLKNCYFYKEIIPRIRMFFVQEGTICGYNKLLMGLTNTSLGRGGVRR